MKIRTQYIAETLVTVFDDFNNGGISLNWSALMLISGKPKLTDEDVFKINKYLLRDYYVLVPHSDCVAMRNLLDTENGAAAIADLTPVSKKLLRRHYPEMNISRGARELQRLQRQYLRNEGLYAPC